MSVSQGLEQEGVHRHGRPWVGSTAVVCNRLVHSCVPQVHQADYGVATDLCGLALCGSHVIFPCSPGS